MTEQLFQFIWQHRYYSSRQLKTIDGQGIEVIHTGQWNHDQGPDFLNARIRIGGVTWVGSVELHLKTSDWYLHGHEGDEHYQNVILHVVYEHDRDHHLPLLELRSRVSRHLLVRYGELMSARDFIPCARMIKSVPTLIWEAWRDRMIIERLERRSLMIRAMLDQSRDNWLECFWWMLVRQFGMKVNADAFESLARSIPYNLIIRHRSQLPQMEALLFGQAGLLRETMDDAYYRRLQEEYAFLRSKYDLKQAPVIIRFSRMRPVNFPSVRLAQLATLIAESPFLFHELLEADDDRQALELIQSRPHAYWDVHFRPGRLSTRQPKVMGMDMRVLVMVNAVIPVLYAYATERKNALLAERVISWLHALPAENNRVTRLFQEAGLHFSSIACSQAGLELKSNYCDRHRCLECSVGNSILGKRSHHTPALPVVVVSGFGRGNRTGAGSEEKNEGGESQEFS